MGCDSYVKNGLNNSASIVESRRFRLEFRAIGRCPLRVDFAAGLPRTPADGALDIALVPGYPPRDSHCVLQAHNPFMNNMDEISYWIYTKRAPCLMNYDIEKQSEEARSSKVKPKSVPSVVEVPSPKKKKKRKLSLLDGNSTSTEKQQHVYFENSQIKKQTVISSCKSDSFGSDIDFNIKTFNTHVKKKKLLKHSRTNIHKKNKMLTSTPKVMQVRRSLRQAQQSLNNNSQLNSSLEIFNDSLANGRNKKHVAVEQELLIKPRRSTELLAGGDQSANKNKNNPVPINKSKNITLNGQFEDVSDVSGFTANYIRSTKLQSTKTPRKLRCKNSRNLAKESQVNEEKESNMVVCVNKSVSTAHKSAVQNCSTDSENVINLVTTRSNEKTAKVSKSTSLLKFMESKTGNETSKNRNVGVRTRRAVMNTSFQSRSSASRYPKRYKNCSKTPEEMEKTNHVEKRKNMSQFNNSDRKENTDDVVVSKTRSGRHLGLTIRPPENSVLVLSNSTEQISSMVSMNVATPALEQKERKKKRVTRHLRSMKAQQGSLQKDSFREKSGFSACFSDSDESEPLQQPKYFCA